MAEIFGVVASAAGVVGVAAQAVDGIRKLQQFCKDTRDAPEETLYMIEELELLIIAIAGIEAQICRNAQSFNDADPSAALKFCRRSVETTNMIINELDKDIQTHKRTGSLRAAWKKKKTEAYMTRIERAKTSLALAVSTYTRFVTCSEIAVASLQRLSHLLQRIEHTKLHGHRKEDGHPDFSNLGSDKL